MKLQQAFDILAAANDQLPPIPLGLACGFTPSHLETFLRAHVSCAFDGRAAKVACGISGSLAANVQELTERADGFRALVVVTEWGDLDPRLSVRTAGGRMGNFGSDVLSHSQRILERLLRLIGDASKRTSVVVSLPGLPFPLWLGTSLEGPLPEAFRLMQAILGWTAELTRLPGVRVVNPAQLGLPIAPRERLAVRTAFYSDFPYRPAYASALAGALAEQIAEQPRRKGIITDLDNTLWKGLIGERGAQGVTWHLDDQSHAHALYQELLAGLAASGTLIAVASKNEPELVHQAFARRDMLLPIDCLHPMEVHWGPKSASVRRILQTWNVGAESVTFLDDSPHEVAEVAEAFPEMQCRLFPAGDPEAIYDLLVELRRNFAPRIPLAEDLLRHTSLRHSPLSAAADQDAEQEAILADAQAEVLLRFDGGDQRTYELVGKTNQFHLNGRRPDRGQWYGMIADPDRFLMRVEYRDKFGALGQIAVIGGRHSPKCIVDVWAMSCRAFGRRIEFHTIQALLDQLPVQSLEFDFARTEKNRVMQRFFEAMLGSVSEGPVSLTRSEFSDKCPPLYGTVIRDDRLCGAA